MFIWTNESIRWYERAANHSNFYHKLAAQISPYLNKDDSLCDLGCGLGYLSIALSPYVNRITSIDIDSRPLKVLSQNIKSMKIKNINPCHQNAMELSNNPANKWDTLVLCYFGQILNPSDFDYFYSLCHKQIIIIANKNWQEILELPPHLIIKRESLSLNFNQPFNNPEEARMYFAHYLRGKTHGTVEDRMKELVEDGAGNLFLPKEKQMDIIVIKKGDY
ncbi:MAG: class I SAM-dependent methyltransferase [Anaerovoracaceae bacterium]